MTSNLVEGIILALINAASVFLVIVVLANSLKEPLYRWFVVMTLFLVGWVDFAYLGYSNNDLSAAILFYKINWSFVAGFFLAAYIFYIENFLKISNKKFKGLLIALTLIFIFLSLFTDSIIQGVIRREWGNEINFGPINLYFNLYAVLITGILVYYFVSRYFKLTFVEKRKVIYFLIGTFFLIVFNVIFNILSPTILGTAEYQHLGDYSAVLFLAFTAYAILKGEFLGVKVTLTALLISIIGVLLIIDILALSNNLLEQVVKIIIFTFFVIISIILVRGVLTEKQQSEELVKVNKALKDASGAMSVELKNTKSLYNLTSNVSKTLNPREVAQAAVDSLPQDESMMGSSFR